MKIVLDCNVIISAGLNNGKCREVLKAVLNKHTNYISDEIVREYRDVILRKKFELYKSNLIGILESVCLVSSWIGGVPTNNEFKLQNVSDQKYLDLVISIAADYIITGNTKDFTLRNYNSLSIINPDEFLKLSNKNYKVKNRKQVQY